MSEYRALYRKWRPASFDDVSGQNHITDILKYEVSAEKLSHAYLFCGSRGTGKTTCAKILAKAVNCTSPRDGSPCNECEACRSIDAGIATDVIEMDAASNNGVDNVRDMKDEIAFTPALLKYRVYIIDEVHMMSASAFNALLKTLEEPPTYVIFILATTEFHKLPTTIVSRCQRFDFRRIDTEDIVNRLMKISEREGIELTEDGARVIARISRGGMRDAISLLELCAGARRSIDAPLVFETVGSGNRDNAYKLIRAIAERNYSAVYSTVNDVVMSSGDLSVFWQEIIDSYRDVMVVKNTERAREYLDLTEQEYSTLSSLAAMLTPATLSYHVSILENALADMQRAFNSKRSIAEIALTRMCDARSTVSIESMALRIEQLEKELSMLKLGGGIAAAPEVNEDTVRVLPTTKEEASPSPEVEKKTVVNEAKSAPGAGARYDGWGAVLDKLAELKPSLAVKFSGSSALRRNENTFLIRLNAFFAGLLMKSEGDLSVLRGALAEETGLSRDSVKLEIEPLDATHPSDFSDEIADVLNS